MTCHTLSTMSLFSMIGSVIGLNLITLSRLMVTVHPFTSRFKNARFNSKLVLSGYCIAILLTVSSITTHSTTFLNNNHTEMYKQASVLCTVFGAQDKSITLVTVNIMVSVFQLCAIISIVLMSIILKREIYSSNPVTDAARQRLNRTALNKIILAALLNIFTWLPSSLIHIISVSVENYPTELIVWNTILINSTNPCFIPLILNVRRPCIRNKTQKAKQLVAIKAICQTVSPAALVTTPTASITPGAPVHPPAPGPPPAPTTPTASVPPTALVPSPFPEPPPFTTPVPRTAPVPPATAVYLTDPVPPTAPIPPTTPVPSAVPIPPCSS